MKLPEKFLERMERMLGAEYEAFLKSYEEPRKFGLRVNTAKISVEEFQKLAPFHLTPIPWVPNGFYYEREDDPARHPFYYAGLYYLQEPSAMTPATVLPVVPGEQVLDLCAAPGGKATALGAKLRGEGLLVANDISASRAKALLKNLEVFGIANSYVTNAVPERLAEQFVESFDKILVDAPCSGEGMFRKDLANARVWSLDKVAECARTQHAIIRSAVSMLRPGGLLLYSTCTFSPEENEQTIASLLADEPEMELLEIPWYEGFSHGRPELADGNGALTRCVRIFPHKMDGEGHFLALLRKRKAGEEPGMYGEAVSEASQADDMISEKAEGEIRADEKRKAAATAAEEAVQEENFRKKKQKRKKGKSAEEIFSKGKKCGQSAVPSERDAVLEFLCDVKADYREEAIEIRGGQVYYTKNRLPVSRSIPFLRNGLYMGEVRKGRFEPSQSLAMALTGEGYDSVIDLDQADGRVRKYLCGETIEVDDLTPGRAKGWQLVCVNGYPLGWGKLVNGTMKNKYHPGWRMTV
ncbi:MAG: RsmB/NOP family class I SAM-dependent RNA methyltransferase [Lachnospiraceae bacterium]|nr:RsmB/NOP family class I SAM-dependent RNA methyltransferase [Lachnospiraceae bacterium]